MEVFQYQQINYDNIKSYFFKSSLIQFGMLTVCHLKDVSQAISYALVTNLNTTIHVDDNRSDCFACPECVCE